MGDSHWTIFDDILLHTSTTTHKISSEMKDELFLKNIKVSLIYVFLFLVTTHVNKYVLSVLKFTYPTIFQGWQTLAGAMVLIFLHIQGIVQVDLKNINRKSLGVWVPALMLYICSIYSGSVALANLPVPVFLCLHNLVLLFSVTIDIAVYYQGIKLSRYVAVIFLLVSTLMVCWTDPQFNPVGYRWAAVHILSVGFCRFYEEVMDDRITLSYEDRVFCNYIYSVCILTPASYLFGDVLAAKQYPFWDLYRFYIGCFCSGVFGAFLCLSKVRLKTRPKVLLHIDLIYCLAKILTAVISLLVFEIVLIPDNLFWIVINLTVSIFVIDLPRSSPGDQSRSVSMSSEDDSHVHNHNI